MIGGWEPECLRGAPCDSWWILWDYLKIIVFMVGFFRVVEWVSTVITEMWTALRQ